MGEASEERLRSRHTVRQVVARLANLYLWAALAVVLLVVQLVAAVTGSKLLLAQTGTVTVALLAAVLLYLIGERADLTEKLVRQDRSTCKGYDNLHGAYSMACRLIEEVWHDDEDENIIRMGTLYGADGDKVAEGTEVAPSFRRFENLFGQCVTATGRETWHVQALYNVTTEDRLDMIAANMQRWERAERYEVRAFFRPKALPMLGPLIVGQKNVLLGSEDDRYYRTGRAVHMQGQDVTRILTRYFDSLWVARDTIILRSGAGVSEPGIHELRSLIQAARPRDAPGVDREELGRTADGS